MNVTLEYLAVGLLIVTILLAFNQVVGSLTPRLESVRSEQLFTVAERVMDKIVLTPGYPEDWGRDIEVTPETLKDFGLALAGSRSPYVLDPDKVMRLANLSTLPNPLLLNATRLAEILALKNDYGFRLVMKPFLSISFCNDQNQENCSGSNDTRFVIRLTNWYGTGIPGANVTGMYVIVCARLESDNRMRIEGKTIFIKNCITNAIGSCAIDYTSERESYLRTINCDTPFEFLITHASWRGLVSIDSKPNVIGGYIIGNYIFLNPEVEIVDIEPGAASPKDELLQAVPAYGDLLGFTNVTWCRDRNGNFKYYNKYCEIVDRILPFAKQRYLIGYIHHVEPLASHVFVFAKYRGTPVTIVVNRIPHIDITYGARETKPANSVTLRRLAVLYNYPYAVELTIWRRVEGWP
ncbi:MAG: hypothetical protein QXJ64_10335 [Thermosphaera sp.]